MSGRSRAPFGRSTVDVGHFDPTDFDASHMVRTEELAELLAKAETEKVSREEQNRVELRADLERRVASAGYTMGDIFPELAAASARGARRRDRTNKPSDGPCTADQLWLGGDITEAQSTAAREIGEQYEDRQTWCRTAKDG